MYAFVAAPQCFFCYEIVLNFLCVRYEMSIIIPHPSQESDCKGAKEEEICEHYTGDEEGDP